MRQVVIVGNGMAGHRVAAELLSSSPGVRITVFGAEPHAPYNRVLLTNLLAGKADERSIRLPELAPGATVRAGVEVTGIDREACTVTAADSSVTGYDALVLATGGSALLPPVGGLRRDDGRLLPGITGLRTLDDCREVFRLVAEVARRTGGGPARVLVLGGGLLGLEAARGLVQRGIEAEILQADPWLMSRQLDAAGGRALLRGLTGLGVAVRVGVRVASVVGDGRFEGVRCSDGQLIPGDVLIVACGMRPATTLAADAGLPVERGIVVDDLMRTADPRIFAVGDCAEHRGTLYGLVQPAWEQARVAARTIAALPGVRPFRGSRVVTRLKTTGIDLATMGEVGADGSGEGEEVLSYCDSGRNVYQKVVVRDGRVAGAILVGGSAALGTITQLFDRRAAVPQDRRLLLFPELAGTAGTGASTGLAADALVCQCNGVPREEVLRHGAAGSRTVESIATATRATTGCGGCRPLIEELLAGLAHPGGTG
ncbi:FAD-dependent oxidoreductase [Streptomyces sp. TG1A-8]|uniref:FAD-dependent oxidoreductase n=1 Tax=Streptomyces sp. TG1A-8 TaxID=3051385 RepID=UPI00265C76AD|nr:FAD-dependent oxidoreductase [Streptomyces sp. TG1A-8]MDO0925223.1 FAD-dependent oxidoreductase [Streptomyces sp. TG1A-8]